MFPCFLLLYAYLIWLLLLRINVHSVRFNSFKKKRKNANIEHHIDWERKRNDIFSPNHYTQQHTIWITKKTLFIVYLKEKEDEAILFIFSDFSLECIFCTQITHTSTTHNRNCIFFSFVSQQQCVLIWLSLEYGNAFFYSFAIGFWFITCMYYVVATVCCFFAIYRPFTVLIFRFLAISFIVFRMHITIYLLLHKSFFSSLLPHLFIITIFSLLFRRGWFRMSRSHYIR